MTDYDIYVNSIRAIAKSMSLPIEPMTIAQYDQAAAAARARLPHTFASLIDMDAFEAAFNS